MVASKFLFKLIEFVTNIVVGLLGIRIILKMFGASTTAPFVIWIYDTTKPILSPFQGMFPSPEIAPRLTLEFSAIFALVVYSFVGYLLTDALRMVDSKSKSSKKII